MLRAQNYKKSRRCLYLLLGFIFNVFSIIFSTSATAAELYEKAQIDSNGQLHIVTIDNREILPSKREIQEAGKTEKQVAFSSVVISGDKTTIGWLAEYPNCCTSYPIPRELVIFRNGKVSRVFTGAELPIWKWKFENRGTQVSFEQETVHGGMGIHYELCDIESGTVLGRLDGEPTPKSPAWIRNLNLHSLLPKQSWNVGESSLDELNNISSTAIAAFVIQLLGDVEHIGRLGEYKFEELNNDKKYDLIATIDYSGRGFYNNAVIIWKSDDHFEYQSLEGFEIDLDEIVVNLDNDGKKELLIPRLLSLYRGAKPMARWTDIYKWDGKKYSKVNKAHKSFYAKKLLELESKIRNAADPIEKSVYQIEAEKAKRLIDPNSRAGFDTAAKLYSSDNPDLKEDAIRIWEDIGDTDSLEMLRKAESNPSKFLSEQARLAKEGVLRRHQFSQKED